MYRSMVAGSFLVLVACDSEPAPPCTFKLSHSTVLFEQEYPSYEALLKEPARTVAFEENGIMVEVTIGPGKCKAIEDSCVYPLVLEHLRVSSRTPNNLLGYECVGEHGAISSSIDVARIGTCKN
jgi:hypothetical protein